MRKLLSIGEKEISIGLDREIVCEVVEANSDFFISAFKAEQMKENAESRSEDKSLGADFLEKAIKDKNLSFYLNFDEHSRRVLETALPLLILKANPELGFKKSKATAAEWIAYTDENGVTSEFSSMIVNFIIEGFTSGEGEKKAKKAHLPMSLK